MKARNWNALVWVVLLASAAALGACKRVYTYAVVPRPSGGNYRPDTLRAVQNGNDVRVIFRFDTVTHTRTVVKTDTLWMEGKQIIRDTVRILRRDTVRILRRDTIRVTRVDTVQLAGMQAVNYPGRRVDTVRVMRRDTIRLTRVDTVHVTTGSGRVDTVRVPAFRVDTFRIPIFRVDTIRRVDTAIVWRDQPRVVRDTVIVWRDQPRDVIRVDTVRVFRTDTVRITGNDTVRVAGKSKRTLHVPPGHYPPAGQCRVWIADKAPGQQRSASPCDAIGAIPAGAFILFGGEAWDFDYDWVSDPGNAPAQIVALKRKR